MEFRQLRSVVAVARHASFTKGAAALAVAQPALSQAIASLERELGVRLFDRSSRRVALTDAGRAFAARAERILAEVAAAAEEMTAHAGGLRGRVVLGTSQSFAEDKLPKLLGRFHGTHPGVEIAVREGRADDLLVGLHEGRIDVFVGHLNESNAQAVHEFIE